MESEPVAWTDEEELRDVNDAGIGYLFGIDREANKFADPRRQIMLYRHAQQPVVQPVMFIDGDISTEDADKLAKVIREFNEEDERPLAKMARIIRENPHPTNECDMPKAQPAPVVPEEATPDSIEILASGRCRDHVVYQWDEDQRNAAADSWNACRAAILAAAPHDTPALNSVQSVVTVPGKWIPVSERIPEDRKQVILWDAEIGEVTSGHYSHKTQTFYHCGDAIENEITHWMPPPCAPQEVK
uniref:DUF551 domain-containing protein n=3 Tax=Klebsiella pneumoniae complex TaxID=3390273 RepID=UPI0035A04A82